MYSHCIFCKADLGRNESIAHFTIGCRLAFDGERGRLWVVCLRCTRWNLTPLDERWEAIDECEHRFRDSRTRVSTENIGLARLADGTELIRMGQPLRHEMAAWRYGDTLIKRRRREWITGSALFGSMAGVYWGGFAFGLVGGAAAPVVLHLPEMAVSVFADNRTIARVPGPDGLDYRMSRKHARKARLRPWRSSVVLDVRHARGHSLLDGEAAVRMTALLMPHINALGANRTQVQHAVAELETARSPAHYLRRAADRLHHHPRWRNYVIADAQPEVRLALEMATHEEQERRALEGELAELQAMWREAEEIAAISDNLLLPRTVIDFIRKQKSDQHV